MSSYHRDYVTADLVTTALWRSRIGFFHSLDYSNLSDSGLICWIVDRVALSLVTPGLSWGFLSQGKPGQWPGPAPWQHDTSVTVMSRVTPGPGQQLSPPGSDLKHPTQQPHTIPSYPGSSSLLSKQTQFASCPPKRQPTEQFHSLQRSPKKKPSTWWKSRLNKSWLILAVQLEQDEE